MIWIKAIHPAARHPARMITFADAFDLFARRVLPARLTDAVHLRFRLLASLRQLARETSLELAEGGQQIVFLARGATKLVAHASQSRDQIVGFHFPGDVFTVPEPDNYSYSVSALRDSDILTFNAADFLALAAGEACVLQYLLENTTLSLRRCREKTIALGRKNARERLAVFLLAMAERIGAEQDGGVWLDLPMSRRDISESLGLTIETVSRQLTRLRDERVIETMGRSGIVLLEPSLLRDRAGFLREAA